MKTGRNIFIAFVLNLAFAIFEFLGGMVTGSVAIVSDAIHDGVDALSIGLSWLLEKKSCRKPDAVYTYGYTRYSVLGGVITTSLLLLGSGAMIANALRRLFDPVPVNYNGMILFAVVGVTVNLCAAFFTREGDSVNQKAVNLHMLEDVLGWLVVLVGAVVMRFTDLALLDPLLSIGVSVFILIHAVKHLMAATGLLLEKAPEGMDGELLRTQLADIVQVHHIHVWTLDGQNHCATLHAVAEGDPHAVKEVIRHRLGELGIRHVTVELETPGEHCHELHCQPHLHAGHHHGHHHH